MKKFIQILSLVVVVAITCITLVGCKSQPAKEDNEEDLVINEVKENGIGLKMTRLSNGSSSGVSITATVLPSDATDKTLIWTLEWVERAGYKASSYNLSDFVSKVVSSNTLNCNITMIRRFPMQIKVIVASKTNPDVTASCLCDCYSVMDFYSKEGGATFEISYSVDNLTNKYDYFSCNNDELVFEGMTYDSIFNTNAASFNAISEDEIIDTFGTIETNESYVILIGLSDSLQNLLEAKGIEIVADYFDYQTERVDGLLSQLIKNFTANKETILNCLNMTDNWFELYISFTNKYNGEIVNYVEKTIQLKGFSVADYFKNVSVSSISLDNSNYIF